MKTKAFIAIPTRGNIRTELAIFLLSLDKIYDIEIAFTILDGDIVKNRNRLVDRFLKTNYEWLLFIDSDTIPPNNVLDMIENKKDICSGVYHQWKGGKVVPLAFVRTKKGSSKKYEEYDETNPDDIIEIGVVGTGCLLINKRVFGILKKPYFDFVLGDNGLNMLGEDFHFCEKAQDAGLKVWLDRKIIAHHIKVMDLNSMIIWKNREVNLGIKKSRG